MGIYPHGQESSSQRIIGQEFCHHEGGPLTTYDDLAQATDAVANPITASQDLMDIAQAYPSLWVDIAKHPHAYPALLEWLEQVGDKEVRDIVAERMAPESVPTSDQDDLQDYTVLKDFTQLTNNSPDLDDFTVLRDITDTPTFTTSPQPTDLTELSSPADSSNPSHPAEQEPADTDLTNPQNLGDSDLHDFTVLTNFTPTFTGNVSHLDDISLSSAPDISVPTVAIYRTPTPPPNKKRQVLIWSGAGALAVILAVVLIITLVISPRQSAADQAAIDAFTAASTDCTSANEQLASTITRAQDAAATDPQTMDDPTLLDDLKQAITTAQAVPACAAPKMARTTSGIEDQTAQLVTATQDVNSASLTLNKAITAVTDSVQTKQSTEEEKEAMKNGVRLPIGVLVPGAAEVSVWTLFGSLVIGWGGMARTWAGTDSTSYVAMWYPAMARPSVCPLSLGDIGTDVVNTTFGATAGKHPLGLLQYIQRTPPADASQPTTYQAYSVTINPIDCSLGDPVEYGSSWTDQSGDPTVLGSYVTSDGDIVAFGYGDLNAKWNLYAIDASTSALAWRSGPHQRCNAADPANADCTWGTSGLISYGTDFIVTQTGKVLPLGYTASGVYALGTGVFLVYDWDSQQWVSITADGTVIDQKQASSNPQAFQMSNGQGVLLGDQDDPDGFRYFAPDGSYHQIFTRDQVVHDTIILGEVTQGNVYIQSNGQFLVTDLTGKQIGTWDGDMNTLPTWDIPLWPGWTMWDLDASTEQALYNAPLPI